MISCNPSMLARSFLKISKESPHTSMDYVRNRRRATTGPVPVLIARRAKEVICDFYEMDDECRDSHLGNRTAGPKRPALTCIFPGGGDRI